MTTGLAAAWCSMSPKIGKDRLSKDSRHLMRIEWVISICGMICAGWLIGIALMRLWWEVGAMMLFLTVPLAVIGLPVAISLLAVDIRTVWATTVKGKWRVALALWVITVVLSVWGVRAGKRHVSGCRLRQFVPHGTFWCLC